MYSQAIGGKALNVDQLVSWYNYGEWKKCSRVWRKSGNPVMKIALTEQWTDNVAFCTAYKEADRISCSYFQTLIDPSRLLEIRNLWFACAKANELIQSRWHPTTSRAAAARPVLGGDLFPWFWLLLLSTLGTIDSWIMRTLESDLVSYTTCSGQ